ncbi:hypothetical protein SLS58_002159 [Diplodia intermedia]|uniref:Aspartic-type endopeptidase n=1 Tax=Diplodia intermedia TaxID=856260 RepID=A0ABR3TZR6_9PEZI
MGLEGELRYISDRFTLTRDGGGGGGGPFECHHHLDRIGTAVADDVFSVTYPGGMSYAMDVGYLSLYGGAATFDWTAADGETTTTTTAVPLLSRSNLTLLPSAHGEGVVPSVSYGLHVGSAAHGVPGSLYWGGYDRARVIGEPVTAATEDDGDGDGGGGFFALVDVSLGVAAGASALLNTTGGSPASLPLAGLLDASTSGGGGGTSKSVATRADPGVPYLYLPGATCSRIAAHLPLSYAEPYGLYLWDDDTSSAYERLVTSPHHLSFTFASSNADANTTIAVPLTLLNLTLTSRITGTDGGTTYFPCRPYTPSSPSSSSSSSTTNQQQQQQQPEAILGRAFLQAAFLAQNWQSGTTWLAQAPGPGGVGVGGGVADEDVVVKEIAEGDTQLLAAAAAAMDDGGRTKGSWVDTWAGVLSALDDDIEDEDGESSSSSTMTGTTEVDAEEEEEQGSISAGAKAGVGVGAAGVVVGVVLGVVWWMRRGPERRRRGGGADVDVAVVRLGPDGRLQREPLWVAEAAAAGDGGGELAEREVVEMDGGEPRKEARRLESYRGVSELDARPHVAEKPA